MKEKEKILNDLETTGIAFSHVDKILNNEEKEYVLDIGQFFNNMINDENIKKHISRLQYGNIRNDKGKYFELTHYDFLNKALDLADGNIVNLYLSDTFVEIAKNYIGENPKIRNVLAWVHPHNPHAFHTESFSQRWHRDPVDHKRILKIFVYFSDVKKENGALHYVRDSAYGLKNDYIHNYWNENKEPRLDGYLDPNAVKEIPQEDILIAEGDSGTIVFVDTNGIHKGGRVYEDTRIITHAFYTRPGAYQIVNGPLQKYDYDSQKINSCDYDSEEFNNLSDLAKFALL
jgi:hypothetical protein